MKRYGLFWKVMNAVGYLTDHSNDLIYDFDSNVVEHYNAAVACMIEVKRINFCLKSSYQARCFAAVVSYNSGLIHYKLYKAIYICINILLLIIYTLVLLENRSI